MGKREREEFAEAAPESGPQTRVVAVTPKMAKRWLERNHPNNRAIAWSRVEAFQGDMAADSWKLTHQGIALDVEGLLIDGQHRLHAVVASGRTVRMMVTTGVCAFGDPIDCGRPRSVALLTGYGHKVTGALNVLRMLEQGTRSHVPLTVHEAHEVQSHHAEAIAGVATIPRHSTALAGLYAGLVWAYPLAPGEVKVFLGQFISGEMIRRGDPAFALRTWRERGLPSRDTWAQAMACLNALRYQLDGKQVQAIYTTEYGYRKVTARRRALKVPHTPSAELVPISDRSEPEDS